MGWRIVREAGPGSEFGMKYCEASGTLHDGIVMRRGEPLYAHWVPRDDYVGVRPGGVAYGTGMATTALGLVLV